MTDRAELRGPRLGIYTLANDGVADWLELFARSIRRANPDLEIWLIPFDRRLERTARICARHGIGILPEIAASAADPIARSLWSGSAIGLGAFRKLAAFDGPLDTFLFLDADVVVLDDLEGILGTFHDSGAQLGYFDVDPDQAYRLGPLRSLLSEHGRAIGFNTGAFLSRRSSLTREQIDVAARDAAEIRDQFAVTYEQPFLNFCFDRFDLELCDMRTALPALGATWSGSDNLRDSENVSAWLGGSRGRPGIRSPFVHWAGHEMKWVMPCGRLVREFASPGLLVRLGARRVVDGIRRRWRLLTRPGRSSP